MKWTPDDKIQVDGETGKKMQQSSYVLFIGFSTHKGIPVEDSKCSEFVFHEKDPIESQLIHFLVQQPESGMHHSRTPGGQEH